MNVELKFQWTAWNLEVLSIYLKFIRFVSYLSASFVPLLWDILVRIAFKLYFELTVETSYVIEEQAGQHIHSSSSRNECQHRRLAGAQIFVILFSKMRYSKMFYLIWLFSMFVFCTHVASQSKHIDNVSTSYSNHIRRSSCSACTFWRILISVPIGKSIWGLLSWMHSNRLSVEQLLVW